MLKLFKNISKLIFGDFYANKMIFEEGNLRQQTRQSAVWAGSTKHFTSSSRNGLLICASSLQVKFTTLQVS